MLELDLSLTLFTSQVVNPDREDGRVTLITRYGAEKVRRIFQTRQVCTSLLIGVMATFVPNRSTSI